MVDMKSPEFLLLWNLVHKFPSQVMVSLEEDKEERGRRKKLVQIIQHTSFPPSKRKVFIFKSCRIKGGKPGSSCFCVKILSWPYHRTLSGFGDVTPKFGCSANQEALATRFIAQSDCG
jgi:hypothetical protein